MLVNGKIVKTGCSDLSSQELEKDGYEGVSSSKMNLKFEEFQKTNFGFKELDNIRIKSFQNFEALKVFLQKNKNIGNTQI